MRWLVRYILIVAVLLPSVSRASLIADGYTDPSLETMLEGNFAAQLLQEKKAGEYLDNILKSYGKASLAVAGITLTKHLERKALHEAGLLGVPGQENYYYQHIYDLVYARIIPQVFRCGVLLIDHIDQSAVWGPHLYLICEEVRMLCAQFSAVCSNGTLTFNFSFPQIADEVLEIVGLKDLSKVDWKDMLDSMATLPADADSLYEDIKSDIDDLYQSGKSLGAAGTTAAGELWNGGGKVGDLFKGKPSELKGKIDSLKTFFDETTNKYQVKQKMDAFLGDVDTLTAISKIFKFQNCDASKYIADFGQDKRQNVYVRERWYITDGVNVVYEEWFDSYTMEKETFQKRMESKLEEYNDPDASFLTNRYYLAQDQRREYRQTDELHMEGVSQAIFTVHCDDGGNLGEGSYTFKVNPHHDPLNEKSKEYAMQTNLDPNTDGTKDLNAADGKVDYWQKQYDAYKSQYDALDDQIGELYISYNNGNLTYDGEDIKTVINRLDSERRTVGRKRDAADDSLSVWQNAYEELCNDLADDGDIFRIPHIMNMYQGTFNLRWLDSGHWEGYTWIRKAYVPAADADVYLKVTLERARGESWFLFIRTHRSQITLNYKLCYESESENVVEYLDLDPGQSEVQNRNTVLEHQQYWQSQFPECRVEFETKVQSAVNDSITDHNVHLLWASDRIRVARNIVSRLELIHARLQVMERILLQTKSLVERVKDEVHNIVTDPLSKDWCYGFLEERNYRMRNNLNATPRRRWSGGDGSD